MKELIRKQVLKMAVSGVFICSFVLALMYPVISAGHKDKIHFLLAPNPMGWFNPPVGKDVDVMYVWAAVMKDSTYGSFTMAMFGYETYATDDNKDHIEFHWYTDDLKGGETWAYLVSKTMGEEVECIYDVTHARIDITMSEHQLNATVIVEGKALFSAKFWADTSVAAESRIEPTGLPPEVFMSVEAYRPLLQASVTGLEVGGFLGGRFEYIDTELYDSSLLP